MKRLLQESIGKGDPWRISVVCVLLNKITAERAEPIIKEVIKRWPTKEDMASAEKQDIIDLLRPLGLAKVRATTLMNLSRDFMEGKSRDKIYGLGKYALDSLSIFVDGDFSIEPQDPFLIEYLNGIKQKKSNSDKTEKGKV